MDGMIVHFVFVALLISDIYRYGVGQPEMLLPASQIVLGSTVPVSSVFTCRIDPGISIDTIFFMQISRMRYSLDSELDPIVHATSSGVSFVNDAPEDMFERGTVGGGLDTNTYTDSTLTLTLTTEDIVCTDRGTYQCKFVYQERSFNIVTLRNNATMDTYALPSDVVLTAKLNNADVTNDGPEADPLDVNVNDEVELTYTAKIGSDKNTLIKWKRTTVFGTTNTFNQFNPSTNPSVVRFSDGTASTTMTDCSYSRTATMAYNVTSVETSRQNDLAFQCYVEVKVKGVTYTTNNPPEFYINPVTYDGTTPSGATITSDVTATSGATITSDVTATSVATITYDGTTASGATITSDVTATSGAKITSDVTATSGATITSDVTATSDATITYDGTIPSGATLTSDVTATSGATITSDVTATSVATITSDVTSPSVATITYDVTATSVATKVMFGRSFFILLITCCVVERLAATMNTMMLYWWRTGRETGTTFLLPLAISKNIPIFVRILGSLFFFISPMRHQPTPKQLVEKSWEICKQTLNIPKYEMPFS